ncbi:hypothetical protein N0V85_000934 [Neurospora sp. IMI 360204]|nr:hypothetical protein N0V85_000934 [Neurospora sp. IMI 360204]
MVHLAPISLAAMSLLTLVTAAPAATTEPVFSFAKWVDDVIANPETALGPEEAWQAYLDTVNSTSVPVAANGGAQKRWDPQVSCDNYAPDPDASVLKAPDAVWCVNYLAGIGSTQCVVGAATAMCVHGRAQITGVSGGGGSQQSSCQAVAQTAGLIMDTCTQSNNYVEGQRINVSGVQMAVHIRAPGL